jgi:two-component system, OmpR family, sensor histidine kinase MprB
VTWTQRISFRTRIGLVAAAAVGMAVALVALASYVVVRHQLLSDVDSQLQRQANQAFTRGGVTGPLPGKGGLSSLIFYQRIRADGTIVGNNLGTGSALPVTSRDRRVADGALDEVMYSAGTSHNSTHIRILTLSLGDGTALQVARPLADIDHTLGRLAFILLFVALSGVLIALILGYLVARSSLRPVERLTAAAERVAATQQLDQTIDVAGDDELSRLAVSFNAMLRALDASRHQQAQLVADAGHELRTPLTSLRTNIEVLMKVRDLPEDDRRSLLTDVRAQLEELTILVGDLVELAREDEQGQEPSDVRFDHVVERAIERARRRAPSLTYRAHLDKTIVRGQATLLERAVLNVLDNAAKWAPEGSSVDVWLSQYGSLVQLAVQDQGPGIDPEDLPHIFDRFYRAAAARALPGSGLGLAIVRQVMQSHGGWVEASTPPEGGTLIRMTLPSVVEFPGENGRPEGEVIPSDATPSEVTPGPAAT